MTSARARTCPHEPVNLYQINTRLWVREVGATRLRDVPDAALDEIAARGFHRVWLMGVWAPSADATRVAKTHPELRKEILRALPDATTDDIVASPYAVPEYRVSALLGGDVDLAHLRARLAERGIGLVLDFVPNHTARDHRFVLERPELYVHPDGPTELGASFQTPAGKRIACGKDPHFPAWIDTAQLDVRRASTRRALIEELVSVAERCDGVRCDMAMLLLSDVFSRTWGRTGIEPPPADDLAEGELWAEAIDAVRARHPGFSFMAEAYWGTEPRLEQLGFDLTYDKGLYDDLVEGRGAAAQKRILAARPRLHRGVRFLENHDERRAAERMSVDLHRVAALVAMTLPGVRLFHHGQLEGARVKVPVQLARRPVEPVDPEIAGFYRDLLALLADPVLRLGAFCPIDPAEAWPGNPTHEGFVIATWDASVSSTSVREAVGSHRLLVANLSPHTAQCRVAVDLPGLAARRVAVRELFSTGPTPAGDTRSPDGRPVYVRDGSELVGPGVFFELPARTGQVFALEPVPSSTSPRPDGARCPAARAL